MPDSLLFHDGNRALQDDFSSRRIADRPEERLARRAFSADDTALIDGALYFFLATADADGRPDCSFKGGAPGFVRVTATAIFPNCPRYIPKLSLADPSEYAPRAGVPPLEPKWKSFASFADVVHPRATTFEG